MNDIREHYARDVETINKLLAVKPEWYSRERYYFAVRKSGGVAVVRDRRRVTDRTVRLYTKAPDGTILRLVGGTNHYGS